MDHFIYILLVLLIFKTNYIILHHSHTDFLIYKCSFLLQNITNLLPGLGIPDISEIQKFRSATIILFGILCITLIYVMQSVYKHLSRKYDNLQVEGMIHNLILINLKTD